MWTLILRGCREYLLNGGDLLQRFRMMFCGMAVTLWLSSVVFANDCDEAKPPNVLFIAVDDLRPSLGCYGDHTAVTPNIDRLASRGLVFNRAYCQVAVCNPSRASLMTGLRPDTLGVWTLPIHFREAKPDAVTLPQWLRRSGYKAVSHGKIFHNPTPDPQSWSEPIRNPEGVQQGYPEGWEQVVRDAQEKLPADDWRKDNLRGPAVAVAEVSDTELIDGARTDLVLEDLRRLGREDAPFFLAMGFIRPHLAWIAPKQYWDLYAPGQLPLITDGQVNSDTPPYALSDSYELTHYVDQIDFPKPWDERRISAATARELMHGYYACVSYVDAQIGRILDTLDQEGLAEDTMIILWSDHGWKLGEFNGWGKMSNYEIDTRVPLIISAPGMASAGKTTESLVELLDLYPTICELTGLETPEFAEGCSLVPVLEDPAAGVKPAAFSQYYRKYENREYMGYAMRTATHRFVEWRDFTSGEVTARELYEHGETHAETQNLVGAASAEFLDRLTEQLLQSHPRRALSMTPAVHSNPSPGRFPVPIQFHNQTSVTVKIHPISATGRRSRAHVLQPGEETQINARIGGVFVVESDDGLVYQIHSPVYPARPVVIEPDPG